MFGEHLTILVSRVGGGFGARSPRELTSVTSYIHGMNHNRNANVMMHAESFLYLSVSPSWFSSTY